jgi:hypothetical protein
MEKSAYLEKPFVLLAVALQSMLAETEAKLATAGPAEKARLQREGPKCYVNELRRNRQTRPRPRAHWAGSATPVRRCLRLHICAVKSFGGDASPDLIVVRSRLLLPDRSRPATPPSEPQSSRNRRQREVGPRRFLPSECVRLS